jgi:hypothetical protein
MEEERKPATDVNNNGTGADFHTTPAPVIPEEKDMERSAR